MMTTKIGTKLMEFCLFNQKNSSMLCIGVNKIKIHFDTSQLCCGVVHLEGILNELFFLPAFIFLH